MAKIQISIKDDKLKIIDEYAKKNGLTRSGLLAISAIEYIRHHDSFLVLEQIKQMLKRHD